MLYVYNKSLNRIKVRNPSRNNVVTKILTVEGKSNYNLATHLLTIQQKEKNRLINRLNRIFSPSRFKFKLDL